MGAELTNGCNDTDDQEMGWELTNGSSVHNDDNSKKGWVGAPTTNGPHTKLAIMGATTQS